MMKMWLCQQKKQEWKVSSWYFHPHANHQVNTLEAKLWLGWKMSLPLQLGVCLHTCKVHFYTAVNIYLY